jgi:hypothetical protein
MHKHLVGKPEWKNHLQNQDVDEDNSTNNLKN